MEESAIWVTLTLRPANSRLENGLLWKAAYSPTIEAGLDDTQRAEEAYDDLIKIIEGNQIPITILKEGDELLLGGGEVRFSVLHPLELEGSVNDNVLVFWIVYKETSFLLTSDMQELDQDELLARYPQVKSANIVQVPHHGGKMTERFTVL